MTPRAFNPRPGILDTEFWTSLGITAVGLYIAVKAVQPPVDHTMLYVGGGMALGMNGLYAVIRAAVKQR